MQVKGGGSMSKVKRSVGRPSVYDTRIKPFLHQIHKLREAGFNHDEIWPMLNIASSTYYKHMKEIEQFTELLKSGDANLLENLKSSLYQIALGQAKKVVRVERTDANGNKSYEERVEDLPPNQTALFFSLTNLDPENWKHKQDVVINNYDDEVDSFAESLNKDDKS